MDILVVGSGGREHAIIKKLKESPLCGRIYCAPGNGGISADAQLVDVKATDIPGMVQKAKELKPDFIVVAPDDPLVLGMVDALEEAGFPCFGPFKAAARIEGSKVFSKAMMKKYGVPTAAYESFSDIGAAIGYANSLTSYPIWIKTDGLALGKGAVAADSPKEAAQIIKEMMEDKKFGDSGSNIVIEENMEGPEVTVLCLTDGKTIRPMASSMDHKRALDFDQGLNTGGMGTIAPSPLYTEKHAQLCMERIFKPTIEFMQKEGCPFKGCLYVGLMLTKDGPKVIEYNCRFGDPEAQVVLPLLDGDLLELMIACREGTLDQKPMAVKPGAAACVVLASGGYPESYETGFAIEGLDENGGAEGVCVIHAGTKRQGEKYLTAGGRVLGLVATANTLENALEQAYNATGTVSFTNMHFRKDIGRRAVEGK